MPTRTLILCALGLVCGLSLAAHGPQDAKQRATAAYVAHDWPATEAAAKEMLATDAKSSQAHFFLAVALMHQKRAENSLGELDAAAKLGYPAPAVDYRRACALVVLGRLDDAFAALHRAIGGGFSQAALLDEEPLLAPLRADPRFAQTRAAIEKTQHPCRHDPRYRQFDFWVGTWDVRPNGAPESTPPSENVVTLEQDGCVVVEHWAGRSGLTGSSFNIYDASRGEWFQTWVDSSGGLHEYHGSPDAHGNMVFTGTTPGSPGQPKRLPTHLTFFRLGPDKVRQYSESSNDGDKTWRVNYDLIYVRRAGTAKP